MTEKFLLNGLSLMGEDDVVGIKVCTWHSYQEFFFTTLVNQNEKKHYLYNFIVLLEMWWNKFLFPQYIRNKFTGEQATYAFIQFESDAAALMAMHKLNGKIIPNSQPVTFTIDHFNLLKLFKHPDPSKPSDRLLKSISILSEWIFRTWVLFLTIPVSLGSDNRD
jgi:hypothetical protein